MTAGVTNVISRERARVALLGQLGIIQRGTLTSRI